MRSGEKSVSTKQTRQHGSQCDVCKLWFAYLHPGANGRFLCRMCVALEPGNRSTGRAVQVAAGQAERRSGGGSPW
jgi:hypothetical protein